MLICVLCLLYRCASSPTYDCPNGTWNNTNESQTMRVAPIVGVFHLWWPYAISFVAPSPDNEIDVLK